MRMLSMHIWCRAKNPQYKILKSFLIDSNGPNEPNNSSPFWIVDKAWQRRHVSVKVCGMRGTQGHPCSTGGICVVTGQNMGYCSGNILY